VEDLDVVGYLKKVRATTKHQPRWSVEENAIVLGFFSFGKFLMYKDFGYHELACGCKAH